MEEKESIPIYPKRPGMSEVEWLLNTRKYISPYDVHDVFLRLHEVHNNLTPTLDKMKEVFQEKVDREIRVTIEIVSYDYEISQIREYLDCIHTKQFGIALAIEYRMLKEVLQYGSKSDVITYHVEHVLDKSEIKMVIGSAKIGILAARLVDTSNIMYTNLVTNFQNIIRMGKTDVIEPIFIGKYIAHSNFHFGNTLLRFLFEEYPESHPDFSSLDCMRWDPFTKSKRHMHWLKVKERMQCLSVYYNCLDNDNDMFLKNKEYISKYKKFILVYSS